MYLGDHALLYITYVMLIWAAYTYPCYKVALQSVNIANTLD